MLVRKSRAYAELCAALALCACAADPTPTARPVHAVVPTVDAGAGPAADVAAEPDAGSSLPAVPSGPAALALHIPRGIRQPLSLAGRVEQIAPAEDAGVSGFVEVVLGGQASEPRRFYLLVRPAEVTLPFGVGDRIFAEIDCRKGGWHRVCDGVVRDDRRQVILIVSGSGDERIAEGWKIERGPVSTSEHHPGTQKSIEHTHALVISREGRSSSVLPHVWHRFQVRGQSWLVQGYDVVWEGLRPPDAVDHRSFSMLRER